MSLLNDPVDTLHVFREVDSTDSLGNPVKKPAATPAVVHGRMQPSGSGEVDGQNASTLYTFRGREFPGGTIARVEWANHDGGPWTFDVNGEPQRRNGSPTTRHVTVPMRARTSEPLAED